jgi:hypothetical protein
LKKGESLATYFPTIRDDPGMYGEFLLPFSQLREYFVLDDETDAPQNDQPHDGQVHN